MSVGAPPTNNTTTVSIDSSLIEAKLMSVDIEDQEEGLTLICQKLLNNKDILWLNNICLKLADLIVSDTTKNIFRLQIVETVFKEHSVQIQNGLINSDEFLSRISHQFKSNDP